MALFKESLSLFVFVQINTGPVATRYGECGSGRSYSRLLPDCTFSSDASTDASNGSSARMLSESSPGPRSVEPGSYHGACAREKEYALGDSANASWTPLRVLAGFDKRRVMECYKTIIVPRVIESPKRRFRKELRHCAIGSNTSSRSFERSAIVAESPVDACVDHRCVDGGGGYVRVLEPGNSRALQRKQMFIIRLTVYLRALSVCLCFCFSVHGTLMSQVSSHPAVFGLGPWFLSRCHGVAKVWHIRKTPQRSTVILKAPRHLQPHNRNANGHPQGSHEVDNLPVCTWLSGACVLTGMGLTLIRPTTSTP